MNIIVALLIFSLIVVIHELGHFLLAVKNGIFVTEFSIGMGPRIITLVKTAKGYRPRIFLNQKDFDNTEEWKDTIKYSIKLLPLGGSCMMLGEDELVEDNRAFGKKGVWARISVIFAGPFFNFIFAFILALFIIGTLGYDPAVIMDVKNGTPAAEAGLQVGDVITKFEGRNINISRELDSYLYVNPLSNKEVTLSYKRDGVKNTVTLAPVRTYWLGFYYDANNNKMKITNLHENQAMAKAGMQIGDIITNVNGADIGTGLEFNEYMKLNPVDEKPIQLTYLRDGVSNTITVQPELANYNIGTTINSARVKTNVLDTIKYSAIEVKFQIIQVVDGLSQMIKGKVSADEIAGPVGIFGIIGDRYEESKSYGILTVFLSLANISLMLSANLGVMNLLPIPALDGGRLVFLFLEVLRGKPISQSKEGFVHMIGLIALMLLMVFVFFNDISRLF